jgi:hypothetical protein
MLSSEDLARAKRKARRLEKRGWRAWLTTLFPFAFEEEFSADHVKFWDLFWSVLFRIRKQQGYLILGLPMPADAEIAEEEYTALLVLGRGLGKSQTLEASSVMRGAVLDGGYCLYVCEAQDQASEHIGNCRELIEHDASKLVEYYPRMAEPKQRKFGKSNEKWSEELFVCGNGWICRAKGLNSRLRGLRIGRRRPDDINVDDIDGVNDSLALSMTKLRQLTSSVFPTQARAHATIKFGQNLITDHSVMNQVYTGKTDALAARTTIGMTKTFTMFDYESYTTSDGKLRHRILPTSIPSWKGVDIQRAQKFLNDSGLETFLAEYQNEFEHLRDGRVIPEYEDAPGRRVHVITWSQFFEKFGERRIPRHWQCELGLDIGYTTEHLSSWTFVATSAANSKLPNKKFRYRGLNYVAPLLDDMAEDVKGHILPGERIVRARISHEKKGERLTLNQKHGFHFQACKSQKTSGIPQWRHYLNSDKTRPHPFHQDTLLPDGTYLLGEPSWFDIVDDDQLETPKDDKGLKTHREQVVSWLYAPTPLKDTGMREALPVKAYEDTNDSTRMITAEWGPGMTPLTEKEEMEKPLPQNLHEDNIPQLPDSEQTQAIHARTHWLAEYEGDNKPQDEGAFYLDVD